MYPDAVELPLKANKEPLPELKFAATQMVRT